jgi:hypothetical protein
VDTAARNALPLRKRLYSHDSTVHRKYVVHFMPFEHRIQELSKQLADCHDDAQSLKLAQELQTLLHERIEQLRSQTEGLPLLTRRDSQD